MSASNIIELLGFCLNNTYFLLQDQFFEQTKGAAMGSPVRPIIPNLYMEEFEYRTITTEVNPPRIWKKYVEDTFMIKHQLQKEEFLKHINSVDPSIQFTVNETRSDGYMPFPDTIVTTREYGTFTTGVYWETHTY